MFVGIDFIYSHTFLWSHDVCGLQPLHGNTMEKTSRSSRKDSALYQVRISNLNTSDTECITSHLSARTSMEHAHPTHAHISTPDVTHKLGQVWNKIYTQISTFGGRAKKENQNAGKLNPTILTSWSIEHKIVDLDTPLLVPQDSTTQMVRCSNFTKINVNYKEMMWSLHAGYSEPTPTNTPGRMDAWCVDRKALFHPINSTEVSYIHKEPSVHLFTYLVSHQMAHLLSYPNSNTCVFTESPRWYFYTITYRYFTYLGKKWGGKYRGL